MSHSAFCVFCCIVVPLQHVRVKNGASSVIELALFMSFIIFSYDLRYKINICLF